MKKQLFIIGLLVMMSLFLFENLSWAAPASQNIGLIDVEKLFNAHPNTQKIIDLERQFVEEKQKRQQDLNEKGKGKTREEVRELEDQMNIEWAPVGEEMLKQRQELINQRYSDVIDSIKAVAESMKLSLVIRTQIRVPVSQNEAVDMPVVLYGGTDITDKVIEKLKTLNN